MSPPSKGHYGTGTVLSPCTPRDRAPPSPASPLAVLSLEQRLEQWLHLSGDGLICSTADLLSCRRALKISEGFREWVFKAQAAASGDAIPGLPYTAASEPQAGWSTVPLAYFGVDLGCLLPVPGVEEKPPSYSGVPKCIPSSLQPGTPS